MTVAEVIVCVIAGFSLAIAAPPLWECSQYLARKIKKLGTK